MRPTLSLLKREFTAYFLSPIAYVILTVFLLVVGHLFFLTTTLLTERGPRGIEDPMAGLLGDERFWLVFLFIPPLLTMRSFAEERSSGTLEMLMTAPIRDWQVVFAKFMACLGFYVLLWLPTIVFLPVLTDATPEVKPIFNPFSGMLLMGIFLLAVWLLSSLLLSANVKPIGLLWLVLLVGVGLTTAGAILHYRSPGEKMLLFRSAIDPMPVLSSYLAVFLAGAMFLSLGLFVSSLVRSQLVAAIVSLVLSLLFVVTGFWRPDLDPSSTTAKLLEFFSVPMHFSQEFTRGLIDTRRIVLYVSVTFFCLFLTVRSLESRRWR
ncbi:ABC transporter permease [Tuwongella immobilis]|uniref:ABC-2 type transporter domain-containing protein n=1 Tax=Tuwongella immobilis TaxID=692036 RepID=A0A6C2YY47_9BACT|nr:ABC transporter permease [Tuwongella immobilis]VIP05665.1 Uncharacterized protein OS=Akkermansia muciniphila (strain ATCC BAA-835) GN=Amuc_0004 PE=4 SV=1: ABC2_membrane_4 [Tuwongella immobilis]VTS08686.1 Uncharacterized protein OS=Akkermansia muciniphila (strain ATCC BAA-835) GN=Amuc_0004 PE=4 SV=1: ABC2_membrane_4 [Tuwongella immobilis]